jgi:hypothetical protein
MGRLSQPPDIEQNNACAVFAESLQEARGAAFFATHAQAFSNGTILTCDSTECRGAHRFAPIGVYEFSDLPGHRLIYPPVLEMLDYCFTKGIRRLHLAGAGPTGLAGLFIARFLKLPVDATFSDGLPRLARVLTRDGFIEDLAWKYLVWFYNQVQAVFVPSREVEQDLKDKGVAPEKLRIFAPQAGTEIARFRPSGNSDIPVPNDPIYGVRRGAI